MKKLMVMLFTLLLALGGVAAMAAEEYAEPILYRDIPWETTYQTLDEAGLFSNYAGRSFMEAHEMAYWLYCGEDTRDHSNDFMWIKGIDAAGELDGKALYSSCEYFVSVPRADGRMDPYDEANMLLVGGEYTLSKYDQAIYDYFIIKLTTLYGDVDETHQTTTQYDDEDVQVKSIVWYGANGTRVALCDYEGKRIRIVYSFAGMDDLLSGAPIPNS